MTTLTFNQVVIVMVGGGGVLPYMAYTGKCCWIGYGFWSPAYNFKQVCTNQSLDLS